MNKKNYLLFLLIIITSTICGQKKPTVLKSTITTVGSSTQSVSGKKYIIQQSIGQSGIVGKAKNKNIKASQGFLTNLLSFSIDNSSSTNFEETLDVVISPNPFIDYIKIDFSKKTEKPVYIRVYDTNGKVFTYKKYNATESLTIPMKNFTLGNYLIQIVSGKNKYVKKILKAE